MRGPAELLELERWFFQRLVRPGRPRGADRRIDGEGRLGASARLEIYAGMYLARLLEALEQDFPRTRLLLGDELFGELARAYLEAHPSEDPSLRHVGDRLPGYLARSSWRRRAPYLADLARFERALVDAFDAADAEPLHAAALASVPPASWAKLKFAPHPSLRLLDFDFAILELWGALDGRGRTRRPRRRVSAARVWRRGFEVLHAPMDPREARALRATVQGRAFGEVCRLFGDPAPAARALATWLEEGLLVTPSRKGRGVRAAQPL